jgi:hypothetical protein
VKISEEILYSKTILKQNQKGKEFYRSQRHMVLFEKWGGVQNRVGVGILLCKVFLIKNAQDHGDLISAIVPRRHEFFRRKLHGLILRHKLKVFGRATVL